MMHAITVRQPQAVATTDLGALVWNRAEGPEAHGLTLGEKFAIHAEEGTDEAVLARMEALGFPPGELSLICDSAPRGAIVGWAAVLRVATAMDNPWHEGPLGWVLTAASLPWPIPIQRPPGGAGAWVLPPEVEAEVLVPRPRPLWAGASVGRFDHTVDDAVDSGILLVRAEPSAAGDDTAWWVPLADPLPPPLVLALLQRGMDGPDDRSLFPADGEAFVHEFPREMSHRSFYGSVLVPPFFELPRNAVPVREPRGGG